jgi:hypothetical protein
MKEKIGLILLGCFYIPVIYMGYDTYQSEKYWKEYLQNDIKRCENILLKSK